MRSCNDGATRGMWGKKWIHWIRGKYELTREFEYREIQAADSFATISLKVSCHGDGVGFVQMSKFQSFSQMFINIKSGSKTIQKYCYRARSRVQRLLLYRLQSFATWLNFALINWFEERASLSHLDEFVTKTKLSDFARWKVKRFSFSRLWFLNQQNRRKTEMNLAVTSLGDWKYWSRFTQSKSPRTSGKMKKTQLISTSLIFYAIGTIEIHGFRVFS